MKPKETEMVADGGDAIDWVTDRLGEEDVLRFRVLKFGIIEF
jgi:hypothetical protein